MLRKGGKTEKRLKKLLRRVHRPQWQPVAGIELADLAQQRVHLAAQVFGAGALAVVAGAGLADACLVPDGEVPQPAQVPVGAFCAAVRAFGRAQGRRHAVLPDGRCG